MWFLLLKVTSSHFNPKPKLYKQTVLAQVFPHLLSLVRILGHPYTHANIHACTAYKHMHPHTQIHTLLPLLHLKELIVAAHLPGLHHDCGNIMESHVGFWLNPHPACSCISLRVMVTCSPASYQTNQGDCVHVVCMSTHVQHTIHQQEWTTEQGRGDNTGQCVRMQGPEV